MSDVAADNNPVDGGQAQDMGQQRVETSWRTLVGRIWQSVKANKALVASVIFLGILQALFTKAPVALVKPLLDVLGVEQKVVLEPPKVVAPTDANASDWARFWQAIADWFQPLIDWIGRTADALRAGTYQVFQDFSIWARDNVWPWEFVGDVEAKTTILGCALAAGLLGVLGGFAIYGATVLSRYFATKMVVDLRNEVAAHILTLPLRFFSKRRIGDLISNITADTAVLTRAFTLACDNVVVEPLMILGNFIFVMIFAPQLWWLMVLMVPMMALPMLRVGRKVHKSSSKSLAAMGDATESMNQMLGGIRTVKAFQLEKQRMLEFEESNQRYLKRTTRMLKTKGFSQGLLFATYHIAFAGMLGTLGWLVLGPGGMDTGTLMMVLIPLGTTYGHVKRTVRSYNTLMESVGAMEGIESILGVKADMDGGTKGLRPETWRGELAFENVSFAYEDEPVLRQVSFRAQPGQMIALVGPSGAGKSTAMDLLVRFHDPSAGRVLVDGQDLRDLSLVHYRKHVAVVSQQPFLFNTSIYKNILFGREDASEAEVHEAARQAQIHDFIMSQPQGYETICGERGSNLSGGQMQRITIARAILRNPTFLFLDEATSSLDSESEVAVQEALETLMRGRTSVVVAHRLSTIRSADQILVLEAGKLVEQGTHESLQQAGGLYSRLSEVQALGKG